MTRGLPTLTSLPGSSPSVQQCARACSAARPYASSPSGRGMQLHARRCGQPLVCIPSRQRQCVAACSACFRPIAAPGLASRPRRRRRHRPRRRRRSCRRPRQSSGRVGKGAVRGVNSRPAPCSGPQRCRARPRTGAPTPRPLSASQCGRPSTWWRLCGAYPAAALGGSQPPSPSCTGSAPAARPAATCRTHPWGHLVAGQPGSDGAHSARRGPHPNTTEAASVVTTITYPSPPPPPRPRPCTWPSPP